MNFRVGQKVICVTGLKGDSVFASLKPRADYGSPSIGEIVTIRTINHWPHKSIVTLVEYNNEHLMARFNAAIEPGFNAIAFRPLIERKTDIGFAHEILRKHTKKQGADA